MSKIDPKFNDLHKAQAFLEEVQALRQKLKEDVVTIPRLPYHVFPARMRAIIEATHAALKFPKDFTAASMIYVCSICIGNTFKVRLKNGWDAGATLYMALVGDPGTNKSHPLSFTLRPLMLKDAESFKHYQKELVRYDEECNYSPAEKKQMGISNSVKPVLKKYIVSDATPEALFQVHRYNPRGIGLYADELMGWFKNFNRYHQGSEQETWLKCWSNKPIVIDRKKSEAIYIDSPFISVCGTIQTAILHEIAGGNRNSNGFTDRILMVMPQDLQCEVWDDQELDIKFIEDWNNIVEHLIDITDRYHIDNQLQTTVIRFSPEAKKHLLAWQKLNAKLSNEEQDKSLKGIYSKLQTYCIRFALMMAFMELACEGKTSIDEVPLSAVEAAIELTEYFRITAIRAYEMMGNSNPLENLPENTRLLYEALPETFTTKEMHEKALQFDMSIRSADRLLQEKQLFKKIKRGKYQKEI